MNIIQHHEPIDFEALFRQAENATVGIDGRDLETFSTDANEIHSFYGYAEWKDRIENALGKAIGSDEAVEIINKCNTLLLFIKYNQNSERLVTMDEMSAINEFVNGLPEDSNIVWSLMQDSSIGDKVEIMLLSTNKR